MICRSLWSKGVLAGMVGFLLFMGLFWIDASPVQSNNYQKFSGEIVEINYGPYNPFGNRKVVMVLDTAKGQKTIHCGLKTQYIPQRMPVLSDELTATCILKQGIWAAVKIEYHD